MHSLIKLTFHFNNIFCPTFRLMLVSSNQPKTLISSNQWKSQSSTNSKCHLWVLPTILGVLNTISGVLHEMCFRIFRRNELARTSESEPYIFFIFFSTAKFWLIREIPWCYFYKILGIHNPSNQFIPQLCLYTADLWNCVFWVPMIYFHFPRGINDAYSQTIVPFGLIGERMPFFGMVNFLFYPLNGYNKY